MVTATLINKYGIRAFYDRRSLIDRLFSGSEHDPYLAVLDMAGGVVGQNEAFDVVFAVGPPVTTLTIRGPLTSPTLVSQIVVFKSHEHLLKYKLDAPVIFKDIE